LTDTDPAAKSAGDRTPVKDGPVEGGRPPRQKLTAERVGHDRWASERERERERESCVGGEMKISIPSNRFSSKRKKMEKKKKEKW